MVVWTQSRATDQKGIIQMTAIFSTSRQNATAFAGAFLTAMLFLSTAVGPLPIA